ncbi:MAG: ElyC/SanA/YdcF family protein [Planctomycetota bacterium]|nr:ElyC/SanA/YdcF family protein [Planctomycetota bacterium]
MLTSILRRRLKWAVIATALPVVFVLVANVWVYAIGRARSHPSIAELAHAPVAIVLGASVKADGSPSHALEDRLQQALELHRAGIVSKVLLSGDHGRPEYDETNTMRRWLLDRGVPAPDLYCDHAGFTTYDTMARAKRIFGIERAIVVTQRFHLPRALYTATALGITVEGAPCDQRTYVKSVWFEMREIGARTKAFVEAGIFQRDPRALGTPIPIDGDGRVTWDESD